LDLQIYWDIHYTIYIECIQYHIKQKKYMPIPCYTTLYESVSHDVLDNFLHRLHSLGTNMGNE